MLFSQVFIAELMRGAGHAWHKSCFTCNTCNKRIDSSNLCEREAEIYCRCKLTNYYYWQYCYYVWIPILLGCVTYHRLFIACYGKSFGPKGFGYGIGMTLEGTTPKIASTLSWAINSHRSGLYLASFFLQSTINLLYIISLFVWRKYVTW